QSGQPHVPPSPVRHHHGDPNVRGPRAVRRTEVREELPLGGEGGPVGTVVGNLPHVGQGRQSPPPLRRNTSHLAPPSFQLRGRVPVRRPGRPRRTFTGRMVVSLIANGFRFGAASRGPLPGFRRFQPPRLRQGGLDAVDEILRARPVVPPLHQ